MRDFHDVSHTHACGYGVFAVFATILDNNVNNVTDRDPPKESCSKGHPSRDGGLGVVDFFLFSCHEELYIIEIRREPHLITRTSL